VGAEKIPQNVETLWMNVSIFATFRISEKEHKEKGSGGEAGKPASK
jgi:hypothetical protein